MMSNEVFFLQRNIEQKRGVLNSLITKTENLFKEDDIVRLSQELDELIIQYYKF
ncbi:aspartyl-phosphate phosphatase Spo0E family protein [Clostridium ganghwense]|uniref:Aspartyl-phosphate phosphatase Spo0E family protein n=1 Tax=Clostridium ganghwense TaxID=312089 RepID=A0ABT4CUE3_9CLOT|nr:aspartyl-phosphate phosphatase Spo0E family protein [Clostridium ganghwense]MCY6372700.1 aspartyl-phosphate phosphatase Spo0E family protein [Clostridium ganghwense]